MTRVEWERASTQEVLHAARVPQQLLVLTACALAETVLHRFEERRPEDARPRRCIETVRAWCRGEATLEEVRAARGETWAAADAAETAEQNDDEDDEQDGADRHGDLLAGWFSEIGCSRDQRH